MIRDHIPTVAPGQKSPRLQVGRPNSADPRIRMLTAIHEGYARNLSGALSAFLQTEVQSGLREIATSKLASFLDSLPGPCCLMKFRLHPHPEHMFLYMDCATVFPLLELLLGGKSDALAKAPRRNLTEVEWSLLEEIVKVIVRPLGEAWQFFAAVEFEVDSLVSEPSLLPASSAPDPLVRLTFDLKVGEMAGILELAVPEPFFGGAAAAFGEPANALEDGPIQVEERLARIEGASVEMEVLLEGPAVAFRELAALKVNQVLCFDYPLDKPLRGVLNGDISLEGQIISAGQKPAFRITTLPDI